MRLPLEAGKNWHRAPHVDIEQFVAWQIWERSAKAHIVRLGAPVAWAHSTKGL
ncbi:hypothetical protein [Nitrosococcus watsonii]|uniref:hypothetical protein n=1 Tax=Nitrosococcus watsonii TaxID=473531 RepID=UPI0002D4CAC8|nr:hypothetical protein [Nitrosococcus watsonii]